jgi:hypothetical protein
MLKRTGRTHAYSVPVERCIRINRRISKEFAFMTDQTTVAGNRGASKGLTDIMVILNITRDFLTLVELLDTLPNMQKTPYDVTRSLYQAVSQGRDVGILGKELEGFFGPPKKPAGKPMPVTLKFNSTLKYLKGIRDDQVLYLRKTQNGFFYGALWPWHKKPGNITVHLGYCTNKLTDEGAENLEKQIKTKLLNSNVFDALSSGDGGMVHGISLASFLHMALLEKLTCTLVVRTAGAVGQLHLNDGELIAAESGSMKNRSAAYEIISWDNTEISIKDPAAGIKAEINQPLMDVLIEALRLRNDKKGKNSVAPAAAASTLNISAHDRYKHLREAQKKPVNRTLRLASASVLVILLIAAVGLFGIRYLKAHRIERDYKAVLEQVDTIEDPEDKKVLLHYFISSHKESEFHADARERVRQINDAIELQDYEAVVASVAGLPVDRYYESAATVLYRQFLDEYPESPRANDIQLKMADIPKMIDNVDYARLTEMVQVDYKNRIEAYIGYLLKHPNGRHRTKVEAHLADMSEEYYGHLMQEIPLCDQASNWDRCILLCDNFLKYFPANYRTAEIEDLKAVMVDKRDVTKLMHTVQRLGDKYESARKILAGYLNDNPDSTQVARIKEKIVKLDQIIRENSEWQSVAAYSQNSQHSLSERIGYVVQYIRFNPSSKYNRNAQTLLSQLQTENRSLYLTRIEEQRKRQQAESALRRKQFQAVKEKIAEQVRQSGGRYRVNGSETFVDTKTGLTWSLLDSYSITGKCKDFTAAQAYVTGLTTGGHQDWRLPFGSELAEIYKNAPYFPGDSAPWYWTTEVFAKGYNKTALIVTTAQESGFRRQHKDLYECGAVRAVRP